MNAEVHMAESRKMRVRTFTYILINVLSSGMQKRRSPDTLSTSLALAQRHTLSLQALVQSRYATLDCVEFATGFWFTCSINDS